MPLIEVALLTGRTAEQKRRMAEALTQALVQHGGAKPGRTHVIFRDVEAEDWLVPQSGDA